jgi:hypothetical protein
MVETALRCTFGRRANRERLSSYPVFFDTREISMGSAKPPKTTTSSQHPISQERLMQKMSEVISLREKVAQAELAAQLYGLIPGQNGEEPKE